MIHRIITCKTKQLIKRNFITLKQIGNDLTQKDTVDFFNTNLKNISNELNNKKDDVLNMSSEVAMDNMLKSIKMVEERVRREKLNDIQINVSVALGPISIGMSKTISTNDNIE